MKKKGISLIVLVITIIVIVILAVAVILSIANNNPVENAKEATEAMNDKTAKEQINMAVSQSLLEATDVGTQLKKINGAVVEEYPDKGYYFVELYGGKYTVYENGIIQNGNVDTWEGTIADSFESGTGTENDPYIIRTAEQLAYLAKTVNEGNTYSGKYFKLNNSLNLGGKQSEDGTWSGLEWKEIGYNGSWAGITTRTFAGIFDGNNNSISGLYMPSTEDISKKVLGQALFGKSSGTIKNLGVEDGYIAGYKDIAAIVGINSGTVENCYNKATVVSDFYTGSPNVGGIVGENMKNITNCTNYGYILSKKNTNNGGTGGISGNCTSSAKIQDCTNDGKVEGLSASGGIVGYTNSSGTPVIENCINNGEVVGKKNDIAGIIGQLYGGKVLNCVNKGNITTNDATAYCIGGVAGSIMNGSIDGCQNYANISLTHISDSENFSLGGVVGVVVDATLNNSQNYGNIDSNYGQLGGVVGALLPGEDNKEEKITNCTNYGEVNGLKSVGGIVGWLSDGEIGESENFGKVYATEQMNGGIVGSSDSGTISNCNNKSDLTGISGVGGIVGLNVGSTIENCNNYNKMEATIGIVAGIVGESDGGSINGCSNFGEISCKTPATAGIVGYNNTSSSVTNCGNQADISAIYNFGGIIGMNYGNISSCYNTGELIHLNDESVEGNGFNVGGILGFDLGENTTVDQLYNSGKISGIDGIGGIVGKIKFTTLKNSYNKGNVIGTANVGSIAGALNTATIKNCYYLNTVGIGGVGGIDNNTTAVSDDLIDFNKFIEWMSSRKV